MFILFARQEILTQQAVQNQLFLDLATAGSLQDIGT